ncbi:MAG: FkbM family methyltransferase [Gammaproteobacteria bacterium]|nr:MAG: FkbM family methyltransferase [Gammaproteobacteria bacterium]
MSGKTIPQPGFWIRLEHLQSAWFSRKFRGTVETIASRVPSAQCVLDIGANHGKFAKELRRTFGPDCRIYCVEPLTYNRNILKRIVGRWPSIEIVPYVFSNEPGDIELCVPYKPSGNIAPGSTHIHTDAPLAEELSHFTWRTETAPAIRLDDFVRDKGIERMDFMKIDVEGAVPLVLRGGAETLERFHPAIFAEVGHITASNFRFTPADTIDLLAGYGYSMYRIDEERRAVIPQADYDPKISDYLFLIDQDRFR